MELIGFIVETLGSIMVGFTALAVHHRFLREHKIDAKVFRSMKREQVIGIVGILLIIVGFFLQLPFII